MKKQLALWDDLDEVTPTPFEVDKITPEQAWEHSTHVARRTADALTAIAHSSGVGMQVGDEVRDLRAGVGSVKRKMKWWQAMAIAALTASGATMVGVAKALYSSGEHNGVLEMRLQNLEHQAERNRQAVEHLQDTLTTILRDRGLRGYNQPQEIKPP